MNGDDKYGARLTLEQRIARLEQIASGSGVTDHGALTGLSDDDHTQYLLKAGGTMTGALESALASAGVAFTSRRTGDAAARWDVDRNGVMRWGDGTTQDVQLQRTAANILGLSAGDKIQQNAAPTTGDDLVNKTYADTKQGLDTDLTTIAGLTATTDNFIQSKSSAWASRTLAQVRTDIYGTMTTRGDTIRRGASDAERVALGSAGQVYGSDGTDALWRNFPASLYFQHLAFDPADATTYYFGAWRTIAPATSAGSRYVRAPRTGVIRSAHAMWLGLTVAGSNQNISIYVRNVTAGTEELIATVGDTAQVKQFVNYAMTLAVTQGDALEIKIVCPTWTTNPTGVDITAHVHIS